MKHDEQQQAEYLYFQTDLTKTQIADTLAINRRTLHLWIKQNNWARIKKNAEYMPTLLATNCYMVLGNYTEQLLSQQRADQPITVQEINALHRLTLSISKLKAKSALNESMEVLKMFSDDLAAKDPAAAATVQQYIDEYLTTRTEHSYTQFGPSKMAGTAHIPTDEKEAERKRDEEDYAAWLAEEEKAEAEDARKQPPSAPALFPRSQTQAGSPQTLPRHRHHRPRQIPPTKKRRRRSINPPYKKATRRICCQMNLIA